MITAPSFGSTRQRRRLLRADGGDLRHIDRLCLGDVLHRAAADGGGQRGADRKGRGGRVGDAVRATLPQLVVPAKAGTHNHRRQLLAESRRPSCQDNNRRGVWVPARASLVRDDGDRNNRASSCIHRTNTTLRSRGMLCPSYEKRCPQNERAQGRPGARCTRGLVCNCASRTRTRAYRFSGNTPAFPAQWLYALLRALPGERLSCHRRRMDISTQLDASTAASGPHDFVVRVRRFRRARLSRPPHLTARS